MADENTHFFHTLATTAHKKNFIVSLSDSEGNSITDHEQKANLLWQTFKRRMGISEFTGISYDLSNLLATHGLEGLDDNFSTEEIDGHQSPPK